MTATVSTVYFSGAYSSSGPQAPVAAAPQPSADEARADRIARALPVLDEASRAARSALLTLDLCQAAPAWPDTALTAPAQAHALRAVAALTRNHYAPGTTCSCDGDAKARARGLVKEWLHLWKRAVRYVEAPDANGWDLVARAAQVVHDYAAFTSTGDPADILGITPNPPRLQGSAGAPPPGTKTAPPHQRAVPEPGRPTEQQPAGAAEHPANPQELSARSPWFG